MRGEVDIDRAIAELADRQHGVVTRRQLLDLGAGGDKVDRRLRARRLRPLHRGVFAVGHRQLRIDAYWLAATLACGEGAVLSHGSAAALWELRSSDARAIHVTVTNSTGRRRPGVHIHRCAGLSPGEVTTRTGIPVTTPARTLLDLAAILPRRALERALDQAEILRLFDLSALTATLETHRGRAGAPALRAVLEGHDAGATLTRSALEESFLALCARHGIARPRVNAYVAGLEVDFHWPRRRLVVEVDGFAFHSTRMAFERDRERDAILAAAGFRSLRFSHRQVTTQPITVVRALRTGPPRSS